MITRTILLGLVVGLTACSGADEPATAETDNPAIPGANARSVRVQTESVSTRPFEEVVELTGSVEAVNDAVLSARTAGTVINIVDLGKTVGSGYSAAQLDAGLSDASLQQARAQLESAEANFELAQDVFKRQEPLYRDSIISALEFEQVRTQLNQAQAQLNQAKGLVAQAEEQLAYTRVVAPFRGTVEEHFVEEGEQVSPGAPVVRIVNSDRLKVTAGVPERFADDIEQGSDVKISFSAYGLKPVRATVDFVGKAIRSNSRTFPIEVLVPNPDGKLKPEMIASVQLVRNRFEDAIVVPQSSVVRDETGLSVFVVNRTGENPVAEKKSVVTGPSFGGEVVITEGLSVDDELIVAGMNDVSPGERVEPTNNSQSTSNPSDAVAS